MATAIDPVLPFGKYKGEPCSGVSVEYLDWLIGQDWLKEGLRKQIVEHLRSRVDWQQMDDE